MKVTAAVTLLALTAGAFADLHKYAYCIDHDFKGLQEEYKENNAATQKACNAYKKRNTGNKQWDKCPDCKTSFRGDVLVCNSLAEHIGGDEFEYYCKQAGAYRGQAD